MDPADRDLIIRTVLAESGSKGSPDEQSAVAHVILNRMGNPQYGTNVRDVLFQKNAFEPWGAGFNSNNPMRFKAGSAAYKNAGDVVDAAVAGGDDPSGGADRFQQPEIVNQRIAKGQLKASEAAPKTAKRIGNQVFWSTGDQPVSKADYGHLLEDETAPAKVAGESVPTSSNIGPQDYASLLEDKLPQNAAAEPTQPITGTAQVESHPLQEFIGEHPYIAGGLAGVAAAGVGALAAPVAGPMLAASAPFLGRLLAKGLGGAATAYGVSQGLGLDTPDVGTKLMHLIEMGRTAAREILP